MKGEVTPEKVDLVDMNGMVKKRAVLRSELENYPDLHLQIVVCVIFNGVGELLVHKRAKSKNVNPGDIDHVCGGVITSETPEQAVVRESQEETGLIPQNVKLVNKGVNSYDRYRYLFVGRAEGEPVVEKNNAEWVRFVSPKDLMKARDAGQMSFVGEFFEDLALALAAE